MRAFLLVVLTIIGLSGMLNAQSTDREYSKADSVAALYPGHSLKNLRELSLKLTAPLVTEAGKFRAVYRWVCDNIETDYEFYVRNKFKREKLANSPKQLKTWNDGSIKNFSKRLVNDHKTICTGYACLVKEMSAYADIKCEIVDGYGRTSAANVEGSGIANHSWNAVQLNSEWFLCDPTWSSGALDLQQQRFIKAYEDAYFLTPPSLFVLNHFPLDSNWILLKDKPSLQDFLNGPLVYKKSISYQINPVSPGTFSLSVLIGDTIPFRFDSERDLSPELFELQIENNGNFSLFKPKVFKETNGEYSFEYKFASRGKQIIHILYNQDYLLSYKVMVKK